MVRVLAAREGIHRADATLRVRYGGGLIAEDLPEEEADRLAADLAPLGVRCRKVPEDSWGIVPRGYHVKALEFVEGTILAKVLDEDELVIPEEEAFGIDVYLFAPEVEGTERDDEGGRSTRWVRSRWVWEGRRAPKGPTDRWGSGGRYTRAGRVLESELVPPGEGPILSEGAQAFLERLAEAGLEDAELRATVYCHEPTGPLHVRKDRFDYSCLGDRKKAHSVDNFLNLVAVLAGRLPEALNRDAVERFLRTLDPQEILRSKREQTENFHRWVYQWARIGFAQRERERGDGEKGERA
jgi:hypothetical protein